MIKSLSGPFPDVVYCPTGGISLKNYKDYLSLTNVICVGSSAVVPKMRLLLRIMKTNVSK